MTAGITGAHRAPYSKTARLLPNDDRANNRFPSAVVTTRELQVFLPFLARNPSILTCCLRWDHVKYIIRLEQDCQASWRLHDLDGIRRLHGSRVTPRQAAGRVVKAGAGPLFPSPGRVGKLSRAFLNAPLCGSAAAASIGIPGDVQNARPVPYPVEVRLAVGQPRDALTGSRDGRQHGRKSSPGNDGPP